MRLRWLYRCGQSLRHSGRQQWSLGEDQCRCPPFCTALRSRADNSWPRPADRPSARFKPCESLVMFRAVILHALTIWLNDHGNTMLTNLPEPIW